MIWADILPLKTRAEARAAIARCVAGLRTTAQAAELIGAGRALELSPGGARWHDLLTDEQLAPWRARIGERMFLRWEAATRQRLIQDALTLARDHLEASALEAGVRLGRSARDTLADALHAET
jgi:hypothetical protein